MAIFIGKSILNHSFEEDDAKIWLNEASYDKVDSMEGKTDYEHHHKDRCSIAGRVFAYTGHVRSKSRSENVTTWVRMLVCEV